MKKFQIMGVTDEVTTCDCCGRANLKRTVCLRSVEDAEDVFYGTQCAAVAMKIPAADVRKGITAATRAADEARRVAWQAEADAKFEAWRNFLVSRTGGSDVYLMIQEMGGFRAAQEEYAKVKVC